MRLPLRIAEFPPVRSAPVDQLVELVARDDSLIGRPPRLVVRLRDVDRIRRLRAANLDEGRTHCAIEATKFRGLQALSLMMG